MSKLHELLAVKNNLNGQATKAATSTKIPEICKIG